MLKAKTVEERVADLEKVVLPQIEFAGEKDANAKEINRGLKDAGYTKGEENAIVRKALHYLIAKHGDEEDPELAEFMAYFNAAERVKEKVKDAKKM